MEGVPRLPMLGFELKSFSDHVDFSIPLKKYITEFYNEDAESYNKECFELNQLRKVAASSSLDFMGCSIMKKYFCQIEFLLSRFPATDGRSLQIPFTWEDTITQQVVTLTDIKFEQANILFNIGSLHSKLGSMDNRVTPEGMKVSCTHFQCAAWMFQHLRDAFDSFKCLDLNKDLLSFMSITMLAQAQECILEKSMTDNRKSSITAKVSAQIVEYSCMAIKHLNNFGLSTSAGSKIIKGWKRRLELKLGFYECITLYYMALNAEEQSKWGERLSYLQSAMMRLEDLVRNNKLDDVNIDESIKFMLDIIGGKFNSAKKDNDFIYHDKVPSLDSLPDIKGASLVKGIPLNMNDPEVSGPDIFKKLVPFAIHQRSSLYSEEKAKMLRKIMSETELKDQELKNFLSLLQIHPDDSIFPTSTKIPDSLLEKCASMSVRPNAIKDLTAAMQVLSSKSTDVEGDLSATLKLLMSVESGIKEILRSSGVQLEGLEECTELKKECDKYKKTLEATSQLNEGLHKVMEQHITNLKILSSPVQDVYTMISSLQYDPSEGELEILQDMKKLMTKVDDMMKQRIQLEQKLREQIQKDDITQILVTSSEVNYKELFKEQLEKYNQQIGLIKQNLNAQSNILQALTETNAKYAGVKKCIIEANEKQQDLIDSMIWSYEVYEDLLSKTQQGIDLYDKLTVHVSKLLGKAETLFKNHHKKEEAMRQGEVLQEVKVSINKNQNVMKKNIVELSEPPVISNLKLKDYLPFLKPDGYAQKPQLGVSQGDDGTMKAGVSHPTSVIYNQCSSPLRIPALCAQNFSLQQFNSSSSPPLFMSPSYSAMSSSSTSHRFPPTTIMQSATQYPCNSNHYVQHQETRFMPHVPPYACFGSTSVGSEGNSKVGPASISDFGHPGARQIKNSLNIDQQMSQLPIKDEMKMDQPTSLVDQRGIQSSLPIQCQDSSSQITLNSQIHQPVNIQNALTSPSSTTFHHQQMHSQSIQLPHQYSQAAQQHMSNTLTGYQNVTQAFLATPPHLQDLHHIQQSQHFQQNYQHNFHKQQNFHNAILHGHNPYQQLLGGPQSQAGNNFISPPINLGKQMVMPSSSDSNIQSLHQDFVQFVPSPFTSKRSLHNDVNMLIPNQTSASSSSLVLPLASSGFGSVNFATIQDSVTQNLPLDQNKKSLDEMLLNGNVVAQNSTVLIPKVITDEDLKREQNEKAKNNLKLNTKDCYANPDFLAKFEAEVDSFKVQVDEICTSSKMLESKWRELSETQDKMTRPFSMAIARCYPLKNRQHDIMPFDNSRVKLLGAADDYINASLIKSTSLACPDIIATQAPLPVTFSDFWQMVYDYNIEVIVMLCSESEASTKGQAYWPTDKGQKAITLGSFAITLHSVQIGPTWTERVIGITNSKSQVSRSVIHLNFHLWPPGAEPDNCDSLLEFIDHAHSLYLQQRSLMRPIVVHCSNGVGRTGTFVVVYTAVQEINQGSGIIDIYKTISHMRTQRKCFVEFERQLKYCYITTFQHAKNVLKNYGIQNSVTQSIVSQGHHTNLNINESSDLVPREVVPKEFKDLTTSTMHKHVSQQKDGACDFLSTSQQQSLKHVEHHTTNVVASSITDLQNPEKFSLDCKATKHKITKANFFNKTGLLSNKPPVDDTHDPLNELDPLWSMKK